jgi:hypothetical protein
MEMPMPENTLPMMTGFGQFGPMEMGGMFWVGKVREGLAAGDYTDPGPYKNPDGTVAYEFKGEPSKAPRAPQRQSSRGPATEFNVIKPGTRRESIHDH